MDDKQINEIVAAVLKELAASGTGGESYPGGAALALDHSPVTNAPEVKPSFAISNSSINLDLPDPTEDENRYKSQVKNARIPLALTELIHSTSARIGLGRSGPRYTTDSLLLFQGDHAVTQDALYRDVDQHLLDEYNLFSVQTKVYEGKEEYLLRPDLGRQLNEESKRVISERCVMNPNIQIVVGDGLSATAIEVNLRQIYPILRQGIQTAGLSIGTTFFVKYCRVGVMNDIGDILQPDVLILLIGERPGLGRAESMSAYMAYKPKAGNNDADRDVVCNIFEDGGTNPLEAGAFIVQMAQKMMKYQASGVKLKLAIK
jgi:ethanolamine ammonia-lyase small subunit